MGHPAKGTLHRPALWDPQAAHRPRPASPKGWWTASRQTRLPGLRLPRNIPTMMTEAPLWERRKTPRWSAAVTKPSAPATWTRSGNFSPRTPYGIPGEAGPWPEPKKGLDAILNYFGELGARSNGSIRVTVEDVTTGDRYTVGVHSTHAERDGKSLDQRSAIVFTVSGGKVTKALELQEDTAAVADFWS